ncbi:MAG: tRNA (N6-isopentenyl adenosine(37)-C2)-methylthiotransferase MiaB [Myxococcota bacterium]
MTAQRRFLIRTYGCQMNVHDSEKVANLLHHAGYEEAAGLEAADLLVINTCSIREKAENRLYSDLGALRAWKAERPGRVLGVGGCVAQQEGDRVMRRFRHVDFVFGTHNLRWVPAMLEAAHEGRQALRLAANSSQERFELPERHPDYEGSTPGRAFLTVMEGCDMFCSFCVVPHTRGREISREPAAILAEARSLVASGVREFTLLGQTVNAYGRHENRRQGGGATSSRQPVSFAALLRELAAIPGLRRLRYTSPHPLFFDEELVDAHGELDALCPHVHLPVQSGSDRVLARMRRRHDVASYRALVDRLRTARPDIALTSDLIVGFPGESDADFRETLTLVEQAAFVDSFSFKYSPRPNTRAAGFEDAVPAEVAKARLEELQGLQRDLTLRYHRSRVGEHTEVLLEGQSRRGAGQWAGRDPQHRVVNLGSPPPPDSQSGDFICVELVEATPHSLIGEPGAAALPASAQLG